MCKDGLSCYLKNNNGPLDATSATFGGSHDNNLVVLSEAKYYRNNIVAGKNNNNKNFVMKAGQLIDGLDG